MQNTKKKLLSITNLKKYFPIAKSSVFQKEKLYVKANEDVSIDIYEGETFGLVGESGCGKSVTSLSIMQLLQRPQGQIVSGSIKLNLGDKAYEITNTPIEAMQGLRGNYMSMIFQEPMTSLNPVFRIGAQIDEVIELHDGKGKTKEDVKKR